MQVLITWSALSLSRLWLCSPTSSCSTDAMAGHWCAGGCQTLIAPGMVLCTSCSLGLSKYEDENAVIVQRYAARGFADMERYMSNDAAFKRWLTEH